MQGTVIALYTTTEKRKIKQESITIDKEGIIGDKFYSKDPNRAILITSIESYKMAKENGIDLEEGSLGENILVDINPYHLLPGESITIADVELEITQNCTLCKGLSIINSKLPKLLKNDRGIFAKIKEERVTIHLGDSVHT